MAAELNLNTSTKNAPAPPQPALTIEAAMEQSILLDGPSTSTAPELASSVERARIYDLLRRVRALSNIHVPALCPLSLARFLNQSSYERVQAISHLLEMEVLDLRCAMR